MKRGHHTDTYEPESTYSHCVSKKIWLKIPIRMFCPSPFSTGAYLCFYSPFGMLLLFEDFIVIEFIEVIKHWGYKVRKRTANIYFLLPLSPNIEGICAPVFPCSCALY